MLLRLSGTLNSKGRLAEPMWKGMYTSVRWVLAAFRPSCLPTSWLQSMMAWSATHSATEPTARLMSVSLFSLRKA